MRHTVRLREVVVGHSDLEHVDHSLRRAWGAFRPALGYDLVQPIFRLYAQAVPKDGLSQNTELLERYYKARDALRLDLRDDRGRVIRTSAIHIADYTVEAGEGAIVLDVLITDDGYWADRGEG